MHRREGSRLLTRMRLLRAVLAAVAACTLLFWVLPPEIEANSSTSRRRLANGNLSRAEALGCTFAASSTRHMVQPPAGAFVAVCCNSTAGPWSIAVHPTWAPLGARRFLQLVDDGHFDLPVPLFRCLRGFLCQFGLSGDPARNRRYRSIPDDRPWLPPGPEHREREGRKRFPKGYLAYAGSGKDSRSIQLIVALADSGRLAGGSPWEVPWGHLVGSLDVLDRVYVGYGEQGPSQSRLHRQGVDAALRAAFPRLDYLTSCFRVEWRPDSGQ